MPSEVVLQKVAEESEDADDAAAMVLRWAVVRAGRGRARDRSRQHETEDESVRVSIQVEAGFTGMAQTWPSLKPAAPTSRPIPNLPLMFSIAMR